MTHDLENSLQIETDFKMDSDQKRTDPRTELLTQAFVSIPPLQTRVFQVTEISRGGMFLAFKDATTTFIDIEHAGVERGGPVEIAFSIFLNKKRHRFSVRAKIARITRRGLGVEFVTHNPPQLAELRELFPLAFNKDHKPGHHIQTAPLFEKKAVFKKLAESSAWKEWEIEDS